MRLFFNWKGCCMFFVEIRVTAVQWTVSYLLFLEKNIVNNNKYLMKFNLAKTHQPHKECKANRQHPGRKFQEKLALPCHARSQCGRQSSRQLLLQRQTEQRCWWKCRTWLQQNSPFPLHIRSKASWWWIEGVLPPPRFQCTRALYSDPLRGPHWSQQSYWKCPLQSPEFVSSQNTFRHNDAWRGKANIQQELQRLSEKAKLRLEVQLHHNRPFFCTWV